MYASYSSYAPRTRKCNVGGNGLRRLRPIGTTPYLGHPKACFRPRKGQTRVDYVTGSNYVSMAQRPSRQLRSGSSGAFREYATELLLGCGICVYAPNPPGQKTCAIYAQLKRTRPEMEICGYGCAIHPFLKNDLIPNRPFRFPDAPTTTATKPTGGI